MIEEFLENLKGNNRLKNHVIDYYIDESKNYNSIEDLLESMNNLLQYGCVSGMIGELIYYKDTVEFFENYKEEINDLLADYVDATGLSVEDLFGEKFDKDDPLVMSINNKNLLAWFGFEEIVGNLYETINENINSFDMG